MRKLLAAIAATLVGGILAAAVPAAAKNEYVAQFEAAYPATAGSRIANCTLCHTASLPNRNSYGAAWRTANRSSTAINGDDSDGDGFTNLVEINARG